MSMVRAPVGATECLFPIPWDPPYPLYSGYRVSFPGVKRMGHGFHYSPPIRHRGKRVGGAVPLCPLINQMYTSFQSNTASII